jgi:hypothetical protein
LVRSRFPNKKIADCLSSLDDLLTAEVQKLDALKKYKKGLLQQLFPVKAKLCHGCASLSF